MQLKVNSFKDRVLVIVAEIPKGETRTYKEVAEAAGSPRAARAVGNIMLNNDNPHVPCHRVIKSDGTFGGYNGIRGVKTKGELLRSEGAIL